MTMLAKYTSIYYIYFFCPKGPANIGLTFKAWPERSEGLAWFLRKGALATRKNHDKRLYKVEAIVLRFYS